MSSDKYKEVLCWLRELHRTHPCAKRHVLLCSTECFGAQYLHVCKDMHASSLPRSLSTPVQRSDKAPAPNQASNGQVTVQSVEGGLMAALEQPRRALCLAFLAEQARSKVLLSSEGVAPKNLLAPDVLKRVAHVCKELKCWSNNGSRAPALGTLSLLHFMC